MSVGDDLTVRMEELGEEQVRLLLRTGGWPANFHVHALHWLAARDRAMEGKEK